MPWHLRMIITIFLLLIIVYVYFGFRFSRAVSNVFFISATKTRISTFSVLFLLNLFPILILLYFVSGNISHFFTLRDQLYWPDYVFLYPFWIGLIVLILKMLMKGIIVDMRLTSAGQQIPWLILQ